MSRTESTGTQSEEGGLESDCEPGVDTCPAKIRHKSRNANLIGSPIFTPLGSIQTTTETECGAAINVMAWSDDMHVIRLQSNEHEDGSNNHSISVSKSSKEKKEQPGADSISTGNNTRAERKVGYFQELAIRYLACCYGNRVQVYGLPVPLEVASASRAKRSSKNSSSDFLDIQKYYDKDETEVYYACTFGGRCNSIEADPADQHLGEEKRNDAEERRNKRKRPILENEFLQRQQQQQDNGSSQQPQLLCVAGLCRTIKVIDTVQKKLSLTLSGHGDDIYDLKFSPADEWLLASASKDQSVRLWNIRTATCVAIFSGHEGHRAAVLSISWHCSGTKLASGGMDNRVNLWKVIDEHDDCSDENENSGGDEYGTARVQKAIEESYKIKLTRRKSFPKGIGPENKGRPIEPLEPDRYMKPAICQFPYFSTDRIHPYYVDCVEFIGDLLLSKSIQPPSATQHQETKDIIVLWMPSNDGDALRRHPPPSKILPLRTFQVNNCGIWFVRFGTDPSKRLLATGNINGEVIVWDIGQESRQYLARLRTQTNTATTAAARRTSVYIGDNNESIGNSNSSINNTDSSHAKESNYQDSFNSSSASTVRQVSFSPDGKLVAACCDNGTLHKWVVKLQPATY